MTLPSGSGVSFAVQLDFLLNDQNVIDKVLLATKGVTDETKKAAIAAGILHEEVDKIAPGYIDAKKAAEAVNEQNKTMLLQARNLKAQVREANAELRIMRDNARDIDLLAKPLALGGALLVGGIFAAASKYVKDSKEATATTIAWKAAEDDAAKSGQKIGAVLAQEALPVLKEGTQLLSKFAGFLEANPEVADFALKAGLVALTLGTIGKAVSSGIRLVADIRQDAVAELQLEAARLQLVASDNQIKAAGIQAEVSGAGAGKTLARGGAASLAIPALVVGGSVAALTALDKGIESIQKALVSVNPHLSGFSGSMHLLEQILLPGPAAAAKFIENFHKIPDELNFISEKIKQFTGLDLGKIGGTAPAAAAPVALLGGSQETQDKLVEAYAKYKEEDLALVNKHYADRQDIISNALSDEKAADATLANAISGATSKAFDEIAKLTAEENKADLRAEQDYLDNRAQEVAKGQADIVKIEEDSQDRLKKLRQAFEDTQANAINKRDALALVDARKKYNEDRQNEIDNTNKEIRRRNQDIALRLKELDYQFAKERQRREEDYAERVAQVQAQEAETIKQAQATHAAEIKRIQEQEQDKLKKLDESFNEERAHRRSAFIAQINDLDKYLLGNKQALDASYAANLASLNAWIANVRQSFGTLTGQAGSTLSGYSTGGGLATPPTSTGGTGATLSGLTGAVSSAWQNFLSAIGIHDEGGYMTKGIARVAWNGQPEFAFSGASTRAAEQIVSGKLTQQNALAAMQRGMSGGNVTVNYTGRFDGEVTNSMRRIVKKDIDQSISNSLARMAA